jgi:phytoene dehydrogenase-like protein
MATRRAIIVGSGPNGLAAAVTLARAGFEVTVRERSSTIGGGTATHELTLPGHRHDVCSAVHPMAAASDFFVRFGLASRVELLTPEVSYAQPIAPGRSALAYHSLGRTIEGLGADGAAWHRLFAPLVERAGQLASIAGSPVLPPRHPATLTQLGLRILHQGTPAWNLGFRGEEASALLTGVMAHTIQRLPSLSATAAGLVLATLAHTVGWPVVRGGSGRIADVLADDLFAHGGLIETDAEVRALAELDADVVMLDVTPRAFLGLAGSRLPGGYARMLRRFRYGDGVAKVDLALDGPVPWADPALAEVVTLHLGGTRADIARGEAEVAAGRHPERPYVLVTQPSVIDPTRAPDGHHVLWAYTHVPRGSTVDRAEAVIAELERFAPGLRDRILAVSSRSAADVERHDVNDIGGDIAAGAVSLRQLVARPRLSPVPWRTPLPGVWLCSASTAPGPGVHGQGGWLAARAALRELRTPLPELAPR